VSSLLTVYAFDELWNLSNTIKYGLLALSHRGSNTVVCGVEPSTKGRLRCYGGEIREDLQLQVGNVVAAAVYSDSRLDELYSSCSGDGVELALFSERPWKRLGELACEAVKIAREGDIWKSFANLITMYLQHNEAELIPSLLLITSNKEVLAWRSPLGLTPLVLGGYGFDMAIISSESVAIDILGGEVKRFIRAGEGIYISKYLVRNIIVDHGAKPTLCLFELLYLARPDAVVDGVSVYLFRKMLGEKLAENFKGDVDVVVGVPETAIPYAIGFAQRIGKAFDIAFVATGGKRRSMILSDPLEKLIAIHLKMNPVRSALEGKRVALIDDSMVTGATLKTVSQILRYRVGVKELHVFIASPPLVASCPYRLLNLDTRTMLTANLSTDTAIKYLEVDTLHFLSKEDVDAIAKRFGLRVCGRCFGSNFLGG
jgi:amidophosphoribosyltransferase